MQEDIWILSLHMNSRLDSSQLKRNLYLDDKTNLNICDKLKLVCICSRSSAARTLMAPTAIGWCRVTFLLKMVYCVCSSESPRWGDPNENAQNTFKLQEIENTPPLCLPTWSSDPHPPTRTSPILNMLSWLQARSSHRSSTVTEATVTWIKYAYNCEWSKLKFNCQNKLNFEYLCN